jgi:hypothetical protein
LGGKRMVSRQTLKPSPAVRLSTPSAVGTIAGVAVGSAGGTEGGAGAAGGGDRQFADC